MSSDYTTGMKTTYIPLGEIMWDIVREFKEQEIEIDVKSIRRNNND